MVVIVTPAEETPVNVSIRGVHPKYLRALERLLLEGAASGSVYTEEFKMFFKDLAVNLQEKVNHG